MKLPKVRTGISFDVEVMLMLENATRSLSELNVNHSDVVNAIVEEYFARDREGTSLRGAITRRRVRGQR